MSNLFSNAVKYAAKSIDWCLHLSSDYETFMIDFINDGVPVPIDMRDKIFEPFYRIKGNEDKPGNRSGITISSLASRNASWNT